MFRNQTRFAQVHIDGSDLVLVDKGEILHIQAVGSLLGLEDKTAVLADNALGFQLVIAADGIVGPVRLVGQVGHLFLLLGYGGVLLLVGLGQFADVARKLLDSLLADRQLVGQGIDLIFLLSHTRIEAFDKALQLGVFGAERSNFIVQTGDFGLVLRHHILDNGQLVSNFALDTGVAFGVLLAKRSHLAIASRDLGQVVLDVAKHFKESINLAIFLVDNRLERVGTLVGGIQFGLITGTRGKD